MPELPTPVLVSRGVVGLAGFEKPRAIHHNSDVATRCDGVIAVPCAEPEHQRGPVDLDHLGGCFYLGPNKRSGHMVDGNVCTYGSCAIHEVGSHRLDGSLFEKCNDAWCAEDPHISAAEGDCRVRFSNDEVSRPGGADHDLHMGQTVPPSR